MLKRGIFIKKLNKKADLFGFDTLIFIILNTVFFVIMLFFVYGAGTRAFVYEESYAKQIALIIDNAKPEMAILLYTGDISEIARKNNKPLDKIIELDKENNFVKVSLSSRTYIYQYFSDYDADLKSDGDWLSIIIKNKGEK